MHELILYQGPRAWKIPNGSPFCIKTELFLRIFKIEYKTKMFNPMQAPRGKMPYIQLDGQWHSDSQEIIKVLSKAYNLNMDGHLSQEQKMLSHVIRRMLEDGAYFNAFYQRWAKADNWAQLKKIYFGHLPPVVRNIVPGILRKQVLRTCHGQGISRYTDKERGEQLDLDLAALDFYIADKGFFFGEQPSLIDCTVYAWLVSLLKTDLPEAIASNFGDSQKFNAYIDMISKAYFADICDE